MSDCAGKENISSNVDAFMLIFRGVLEKLFVYRENNINADMVLNELKEKKIDIKKVEEFFQTLPKEEWNIKTFLDNIPKINEIFGISDEEIKACCVTKVTERDLLNIRFKVIVNSMLEYSRFSNEFYDALKYNITDDLSISRMKLLNEMMLIFKYIRDNSKEIYSHFEKRRYNLRDMGKLNLNRLPLEFLLLRILYVSINLRDAEDSKLEYFAKLLGKERISLVYQKHQSLKYS
jgi:hypothetical protein